MLQNGQRYHEQKAAELAGEKPEFPRLQKTIILATRLAVIDEVTDLLGQLRTRYLWVYYCWKYNSQSSTKTKFCIFRNA
jgi:hypothetical protein